MCLTHVTMIGIDVFKSWDDLEFPVNMDTFLIIF